MKIAILTLRLFKNYGGILQNYALSTFLRQNGYDVKTINIVWTYQLTGVREYYICFKRLIKNVLRCKWTPLDQEKILRTNERIAAEQTNTFKKRHIPLTEKVYYLPGADFSNINSEYDVIIVGSDQVWRPKYTLGIKKYFLDFADDRVKKIAYAASFGTDENEYSFKESQVCGKLLQRFDAVSVREESAISLMHDKLHWNVNAIQTLDPTMLLDISDYKSLVGQITDNNKIFVYILDNNASKQALVEKAEKTLGIESFTITPEGMNNESAYVMPPVESWLKALLESKFVITDSFHGCVFSILFNKPFYVYGNKSRGKSRFDSILKTFNLLNRYVDENISIEDLEFENNINWKAVNHLLNEKRQTSKRFLLESLKK